MPMNNAQYRAAYPAETQGVSDYNLVQALYKQQGEGQDFDKFSRDFLVPAEAAAPIPDRTPTPKPAAPPRGVFGSTWETIQNTGRVAASSMLSSTAGFLSKGDKNLRLISDAQTAVFGPHQGPDDTLNKWTKVLLENADEFNEAVKANKVGEFSDRMSEFLGEAVGGAPVGFFDFALKIPWATLSGAAEAHAKGNSVIWGATTGMAKQFMLQKIFGGIGGMNAGKTTKGILTGTTFALETLREGGSLKDAEKAFGTGMLYQFIPGSGKKSDIPGKHAKKMVADPMKFDAEKAPAAEAPKAEAAKPAAETAPVAEAPKVSAQAEAEAAIHEHGIEKEAPPPHTPAEKEVLAAEGEFLDLGRLFHGTGAEFDKVDIGKSASDGLWGKGFYMTKDSDVSAEYAVNGEYPNIRPVTVDMKNPIDMDKPPDPKLLDMFVKEKASAEAERILTSQQSYDANGHFNEKELAAESERQEAIVRKEISDGDATIPTNGKLYRLMFNQLGGDMTSRLKSLGYDGVTHIGGNIVGNREHRVYVAYEADQVKSWFDVETARRAQATDKNLFTAVTADGKPPAPEKQSPRRSENALQQDARFQADAAKIRSAALRNQGDAIEDPSGLINLDRLGKTPNDVKRLLDEVARQKEAEIHAAAGQTKPNAEGELVRPLKDVKKEANKLAKSIGMEDRKDFVDALAADAENMAERMVAARQILADQGVLVDKLLKGGQEGDKVSMVRFFQELDYFNEIMPIVLGARGHIARATTGGRIEVNGKLVDFKEITPENMKDSLEIDAKVTEQLEKFGGAEGFSKVAKEWAKNKSVASKVKYVRQQRGGKMLNALLEFRATNMLSSINTITVNTTSNITRQMWDNYYQNPIEALLGRRAAAAGESVMSMQEAKIRAGSFTRYMLEGFKAIPKNLVAGARSVKEDKLGAFEAFNKHAEGKGPDPLHRNKPGEEGYVSSAMSREYLQDSRLGQSINEMSPSLANIIWKGVDTYGSIARAISFGTMTLSDNFFKDVAYKTELDGLLFREAAKRGVGEGEADRAAAVDHWILREKSLVIAHSEGKQLETPKEQHKFIISMHDASLKAARDSTWQRDLEGFSRRLEQGIKEAPELRLMIPFFKTPVNLGAWAVEHTPLISMLSKRANREMASGPAGRAHALAKQTSGVLLYMAAAAAYSNGLLTPGTNPKERNTMNDAGILEYSVNANGKWYQLNRFDPQGMMIGTMTDIMFLADKMPYMDYSMLVSSATTTLGGSVLNKTYFTTLSDFFTTVRDPERFGESFLRSYAQTLMPLGGLARSINERVDPHMRELRSVTDAALNTYWSSKNKIKLDDFGEEVPDTQRFLGAKAVAPRIDGPARMEFAYLHIPTQMPQDKLVYAADLTPEQFYKFRQNMKTMKMEEIMNKLVLSPGYAAIKNLEARRNALVEVRDGLHAASRARLFDDPAVAKAHEAEVKRFADRYDSVEVRNPKAKIEDWRKFLTEGIRPE